MIAGKTGGQRKMPFALPRPDRQGGGGILPANGRGDGGEMDLGPKWRASLKRQVMKIFHYHEPTPFRTDPFSKYCLRV